MSKGQLPYLLVPRKPCKASWGLLGPSLAPWVGSLLTSEAVLPPHPWSICAQLRIPMRQYVNMLLSHRNAQVKNGPAVSNPYRLTGETKGAAPHGNAGFIHTAHPTSFGLLALLDDADQAERITQGTFALTFEACPAICATGAMGSVDKLPA